MADAVLTLNAGSSSIKFAVFEIADESCRVAHGAIEGLGGAPHFRAFDKFGSVLAEKRWAGGTHEELLGELLAWVEGHLGTDLLAAAGHRIVHGGDQFPAPCLLDDAALAALEGFSSMAPLHQQHNINAVRAVARLRPGLPQFGCFDTAFHQTMKPLARRYGLPRGLEQTGVRKYGFHGLSYEFIAGRLPQIAPDTARGRIIVAHLGSGASLCALHDCRSQDTTMGFSALDGLVMGTRCGALDPGILLHMMRRGMDVAALEELVYQHSGLLGVSGISDDMRALLVSSDPHAREAIDLFVFRVAREVGALTATLDGLDGIVFTAGIGENSPEIRGLICARLAWLGLSLDPVANSEGRCLISAPTSQMAVWVVPTDEEAVIARHTIALLT